MNDLPDFSAAPLHQILDYFDNDSKNETPINFLIADPDLCRGYYAGERIDRNGQKLICRSWKAWVDLASHLGYRLLTPERYDKTRLRLTFESVTRERSFHTDNESDKYSSRSPFARIHKNEESAYYLPYFQALKRLEIFHRPRILALGVNRGDELEPILRFNPEAKVTGIDLDADALALAQKRFGPALTTHCLDLNRLEELDLGRYELILSIGTLQSPGIDMKPLMMELVQKHLTQKGALLLGWPNARWIDGELLYGARPKNYPFSELSLVIKDLFWIKKYLQQHKYRVVITGREYLFLEATKIGLSRKA
ncbi:Methyltransferase type 12 [Nitratifractor salsuginis DSM 16511]|uniref:Methyltransferase type 12 n=2 Tax=Nitratifractor salsuginis TaxID=269261 RepID=E6X021_NITSE|nr:Methyltransferase type 12 [Nitratifractor salsuginis DSM 16511]